MSFGSSEQPLATSFFGSRSSSGPLTTSVSGGFSSAREIATTEGSLAATRDTDVRADEHTVATATQP
ncbi:hypothetical protein PR003_g7048 [Phytophthora rubi]|uniref:Uncharacterized protein n=1 Tax=Phytophthora rubi TaxID=129364 RepID=A0A6A3MZ16_9STRA|nr:hypothetical protein PR002_g8781 [Phytophthora rubi]KAE9049470.1 hypothetical protein PR001_g3283 [Phytophthora rubi]KAE9347199.1 hypothetical protein PR003_g7048 [Phytophthora rubi]